MYMSGFFPCMMFGVPGCCSRYGPRQRNLERNRLLSVLLLPQLSQHLSAVLLSRSSSGSCSLLRLLYLVYAILYGIFSVVTTLVGFRAGFSFSAGATDLIFSASLPAAQNTWMIIPLGIAAFIIFYVVFRFAIVKFDLKTPGREDDDQEAEKKVVLSNDNFTEVAKIILEGVGGKRKRYIYRQLHHKTSS